MSAGRSARNAGGDAHPRATAALALAAGLLLLGLPGPETPVPGCAHPSEATAVSGRSVDVSCDGPASARPLRGPARLLFGLKIDPNVADAQTLEALPGIGPARARAIIAERAKNPFTSLDDLVRVHGIGRGIVAGLAAHVAVGGGA